MRYWCMIILVVLLITDANAVQFENPGFKLQVQPANDSASGQNDFQSVSDPQSIPQNSQNGTAIDQNNTSSVLNVEVTSDVYSEDDRRVLYCPRGNYMVVRNRIYLAGPNLDNVQKVKYLLHPTFSNPVAESDDPANDFEVWIWTWGSFPIKATITTKTGQIFERDYDFSFKTKFEDAESKGIPQVMECND